MMDEWPIWRLWIADKATLADLESTWSLDDVVRACAVLDMQADMQAVEQHRKQQQRPKR